MLRVFGGGAGGGGGTWGSITGTLSSQTDLAKQLGIAPAVMGANVLDITNAVNVKTGVVAPQTYTNSATPTVSGTTWGFLITVATAGYITLPSFYSNLTQTTRTTVFLPVGEWYLLFRYDGTQTILYGEPGSVNNVSAAVAPVVGNDNTQGYGAGSLWLDTTGHRIFFAESVATGAAVWTQAGYLGVPQNSQSAAYTTILADNGKHLLHPAADTTARIWTIDSNANVPYPIGATISFVNQNAGGVITISITTDTMRLAGAGTTGSRTLAANGWATALKITATEWIINGTGLT